MKPTAVEWLVEQLCIEGRKTLINQAKSIEKQQIFDALSEQIVKEKERSYSEEEVLEIIKKLHTEIGFQFTKEIKEWVKKQFKNK